MNGYTKGARNELFALRPAPIQVNITYTCENLKKNCLIMIINYYDYSENVDLQ